MILFQQDTKLMEGPVVGIVCRNWHTSCRDFHHPLAQFPTPLPLLPSPSIASESPWENNRLVVFWSREEDRSDSSSPRTKKTPTVLDLLSLANFFSAPVRPPPVNLLLDRRCRSPLFVSTVPPLPSSVFPLPLSVVSLLSLTSSVLPPVSFSLPPSPLFLLSALPIVAPLPPRVLPLPPVFFF